MKGHVVKIAHDEYGCVILMCILSFVDDISLVSKFIFRELEKGFKELALAKYGRRPLLHLLCPNVLCYSYKQQQNEKHLYLTAALISNLVHSKTVWESAHPQVFDQSLVT
jgi:hypothetical protein